MTELSRDWLDGLIDSLVEDDHVPAYSSGMEDLRDAILAAPPVPLSDPWRCACSSMTREGATRDTVRGEDHVWRHRATECVRVCDFAFTVNSDSFRCTLPFGHKETHGSSDEPLARAAAPEPPKPESENLVCETCGHLRKWHGRHSQQHDGRCLQVVATITDPLNPPLCDCEGFKGRLRAEPPTDPQRIAETPEKRIERLTKALTEAHAHSDNLAEALVKCEEENDRLRAEPPTPEDKFYEAAIRSTNHEGRIAELEAEITRLRAEPPTDGDPISIQAICDALHRHGDFAEAGNNAELAEVYDAAAEMIFRGTAEPPSAPAPATCPTNHMHNQMHFTLTKNLASVNPGADGIEGTYSHSFSRLERWETPFCPDCGAFLGTPEGQE